MFKRKNDDSSAPAAVRADSVQAEPETQEKTVNNDPKYTAPKGRPTPSRKEREAARKKPLVVTDRKAAKAAEREALREQRAREQRALQTGDEKYMPLKDKGKQRRYIRDYVDARFNVGDYMLLILFVLLILGWVIPGAQLQFTFAMWALLLLFVLDLWFMWRGLKKKLLAKFGDIETGATMYACNRAMMIRRLRLPKPQVKRGQYPS